MNETNSTSTDWKASILSEFGSIAADVLIVLVGIVGIAASIFALQYGVRKAFKFFKSSTN